MTKGFATLKRTWSPGDQVVLNLPMPVRYNTCSPQVEANQYRVAVTRGPLVYCAEEIDNPGCKVQRFFLPDAASAARDEHGLILHPEQALHAQSPHRHLRRAHRRGRAQTSG